VAHAATSCPPPRLYSAICVGQTVQCCICVPDCAVPYLCTRLCSATSVCQAVQCRICVPDCAVPYLCTRLCSATSVCQAVPCRICVPDCAVPYLCTRLYSAIAVGQTVQCHLCTRLCSATSVCQTVQCRICTRLECRICVPDCTVPCLWVRLCIAISVYQTVQCHICVSDCAVPYPCNRLCSATSVCQTAGPYLCTRLCSAISLYQTVQCLSLCGMAQKTIIFKYIYTHTHTTPRGTYRLNTNYLQRGDTITLPACTFAATSLSLWHPGFEIRPVPDDLLCTRWHRDSFCGPSSFAFCSTVPLILFTNSRVVFGNYLVIKLLNIAFMAGMNKSQVCGCCGN
jgi:hypothetical protein